MRKAIFALAGLLGLLILFVSGYLLWLTWSGADASPKDGLLTLNTKDSKRLIGSGPTTLSATVSQTLFPEGSHETPEGVVIATAESWQSGVAAASLVHWLNGPPLLDDGSGGLSQELDRLDPAQIVWVGIDQPGVSGEAFQIQMGSPAEMAASIDELAERLSGSPRLNILLVPDDPDYAMWQPGRGLWPG